MIKELQELGFPEQEAQVYLSALEIGMAPASIIARRAQIKRETCYYILKKLLTRGYISSISQDNTTLFIAEDPKILIEKLQTSLKSAQKIVPQLSSLQNTSAKKPVMKFYQWKSGIKRVLDDILATGEEVVGYTNIGLFWENYPKELESFYAQRGTNSKVRILSTFSTKWRSFIEQFMNKKHDQCLFLNPDEFGLENDVVIYGDTVAIISLDKFEGFSSIITSASLAKTQKAIFDLAWLGGNMFIAR